MKRALTLPPTRESHPLDSHEKEKSHGDSRSRKREGGGAPGFFFPTRLHKENVELDERRRKKKCSRFSLQGRRKGKSGRSKEKGSACSPKGADQTGEGSFESVGACL